MKTKSFLLALALLCAGALAGQSLAPLTITLSVEELRYRASLNYNLADALQPLSETAAARVRGKADAFREIADLGSLAPDHHLEAESLNAHP